MASLPIHNVTWAPKPLDSENPSTIAYHKPKRSHDGIPHPNTSFDESGTRQRVLGAIQAQDRKDEIQAVQATRRLLRAGSGTALSTIRDQKQEQQDLFLEAMANSAPISTHRPPRLAPRARLAPLGSSTTFRSTNRPPSALHGANLLPALASARPPLTAIQSTMVTSPPGAQSLHMSALDNASPLWLKEVVEDARTSQSPPRPKSAVPFRQKRSVAPRPSSAGPLSPSHAPTKEEVLNMQRLIAARRECFKLGARIEQLEQSSHSFVSHQKTLIEWPSKLGDHFSRLDDRLHDIGRLFLTDDERARDKAGTMINSASRGFLTRGRFKAAQHSLESIREAATEPVKAILLDWFERRTDLRERVSNKQAWWKMRKRNIFYHAWADQWRQMRPLRQMQQVTTVQMDKIRIETMLKKFIQQWKAVSVGPQSRQEVKQRNATRRRAVELSVIERVGESVTEEDLPRLVRKELRADAIARLRRMRRHNMLRVVVKGWHIIVSTKDWRFKKVYSPHIAFNPSKLYLEAIRYHRLTVLGHCLHAWRVQAKKDREQQGAKWVLRLNRRKVKYEQQFAERKKVFAAWRKWAAIEAGQQRLAAKRKERLMRTTFRLFKETVARDRSLKLVALERWVMTMENRLRLAFRLWYLFSRNRQIQGAPTRALSEAFQRRHERRIMAKAFRGLREWRLMTMTTKEREVLHTSLESQLKQCLAENVTLKRQLTEYQEVHKAYEDERISLRTNLDDIRGELREGAMEKMDLRFALHAAKTEIVQLQQLIERSSLGHLLNDPAAILEARANRPPPPPETETCFTQTSPVPSSTTPPPTLTPKRRSTRTGHKYPDGADTSPSFGATTHSAPDSPPSDFDIAEGLPLGPPPILTTLVKENREDEAARDIQRTYRGHRVRRQVHRQNSAARDIQRTYRGHVSRLRNPPPVIVVNQPPVEQTPPAPPKGSVAESRRQRLLEKRTSQAPVISVMSADDAQVLSKREERRRIARERLAGGKEVTEEVVKVRERRRVSFSDDVAVQEAVNIVRREVKEETAVIEEVKEVKEEKEVKDVKEESVEETKEETKEVPPIPNADERIKIVIQKEIVFVPKEEEPPQRADASTNTITPEPVSAPPPPPSPRSDTVVEEHEYAEATVQWDPSDQACASGVDAEVDTLAYHELARSLLHHGVAVEEKLIAEEAEKLAVMNDNARMLEKQRLQDEEEARMKRAAAEQAEAQERAALAAAEVIRLHSRIWKQQGDRSFSVMEEQKREKEAELEATKATAAETKEWQEAERLGSLRTLDAPEEIAHVPSPPDPLLDRAKIVIDQMDEGVLYVPPRHSGTSADAELRRLLGLLHFLRTAGTVMPSWQSWAHGKAGGGQLVSARSIGFTTPTMTHPSPAEHSSSFFTSPVSDLCEEDRATWTDVLTTVSRYPVHSSPKRRRPATAPHGLRG